MNFLPLVLVVSALAAFLLSTRQFRFRLRAPIWLAGAVLMAVAIWLAVQQPPHTGFIETALTQPAAFVEAFSQNAMAIAPAFGPMLDILIFAAIVTAIATLVAFTPGEAIERGVRIVIVGLYGAIVGALITLAIVGTGFGGVTKRQVYLALLTADDVHDGDTLMMGDVSLRLWGIDAPEKDQPCAVGAVDCGATARQRLVDLVEGELIACSKPRDKDGVPQESFGRPLVECIRESDGLNINLEMLRIGCAHVYMNGKRPPWDNAYRIWRSASLPACPSFEAPAGWRAHK
jgi:endonuclease YncB( thermonuclease family)